jgi:large subunit ribosomal protein L31
MPVRRLRSRIWTSEVSGGLGNTAGAIGRTDPGLHSGRPDLAATLNEAMKTDIHPEYVEAHVRCTCGNEFTTRSTQPEIHVEICSNCHPFYTGRQKLVDTGGRVERFKRRAAKRQQAARS